MTAADFNGKWKLEKKENMEAFLDAINVAEPKRRAALKANPTLEITQNGDEFSTVTKTDKHTYELKCKLGETFLYKNPMNEDIEVNMMATWEGNKIVMTNVNNPDGVKIIKELQGDKLIITQTKGGVTAKRVFIRC